MTIKEKGHEGAVAVPMRPQSATEILADIRDILMQDREIDSPSDFTHPRDIVITAAAGSLWLDESTAYGYVYIPNMPRRCTFFTGSRGDLIGTFEAGANVRFKIPRQVGLTIDYAAGSAAQSMTIWFSTRPIEIDGGVIQVSPAGTSGVSGLYQEDTPHVTGDWGRQALAVVNSAGGLLAADGDYAPIRVSGSGSVVMTFQGSTQGDASTAPSVGIQNSGFSAVQVAVHSSLFNGSTFDRTRNNLEGTELASAARTVTTVGPDLTNHNGRGVAVWLDVTVASGTGGLVVQVNNKNPVTSTYKQIHANPTAITATGLNLYLFYPGINNAGNNFSTVLSRIFNIQVQHNDASSYTYSVGYCIIN